MQTMPPSFFFPLSLSNMQRVPLTHFGFIQDATITGGIRETSALPELQLWIGTHCKMLPSQGLAVDWLHVKTLVTLK